MGLKQDIVIKNEYTNNARSQPGKGSRGASPGQYVMRYMAREDATEVLAPVRLDSTVNDLDVQREIGVESALSDTPSYQSYNSAEFSRYMARRDATEQLKTRNDPDLQDADAYGSPLVLKHKFRRLDKQSGRAFGSKGISLSHDELVESSDEIQEAFDNGHSVQKIILSFTEEYLKETGVVDDEFKHKGRGSYKGKIDQLKLRQAITKGVNDMTKAGSYADPAWVGTIQLDTSHVHAHIALVDTEFSNVRMRSDGADRGKINEREKKMFRKGVHHSLEDMRDMHGFHAQASVERQNVVAFVKDYAFSTIKDNTSMQILVASLPKDRQAWRYGTNRESMKYPNEIAEGIITEVFERDPDASGYRRALDSVKDYAKESQEKNKLSNRERDALIDNGKARIMERSVNGLYRTLAELDDNLLQTRTPMTDIQSSSDDDLARALYSGETETDTGFDPAAFTLRVRGYNKRQESHTTMAREHFDLATEYDNAFEAGYVDDTAHVMRLYYEEEQRYHMGLTDKYRSFLSFNHPVDRQHVEAMTPQYDRLVDTFERINEREERLGNRDEVGRKQYASDLRQYTFNCFERGVGSLREWDSVIEYDSDTSTLNSRFVLPHRPKTRAENLTDTHFNKVKAWDVHHLGLDYYNQPDTNISPKNAKIFADKWSTRDARAQGARIYTAGTGQQLAALDRTERDIKDMEIAVDKAIDEGLIETVTLDDLTAESDARQFYTISPDKSIDITAEVRTSIETIDMDAQTEGVLE